VAITIIYYYTITAAELLLLITGK